MDGAGYFLVTLRELDQRSSGDSVLGILVEHLESVFSIPVETTCTSFCAHDGIKPSWRFTFEIPDIAAVNANPRWLEIKNKPRNWVNLNTDTHISIYKDVSTRGVYSPDAPLLISVAFKLHNRDLGEFYRWYEEEHTTMLSKVPGWIFTRRSQLIDTTASMPADGEVVCIAVHGYESEKGLDGPEFKAATSTEWRTRMMEKTLWKERRVWKYTCIDRGQYD